MLLPLRWLLYSITGTPVEPERPQVGGKRRKLPRAAQWNEYLGTPPAPPVVLALDKGTRLVPRLGLGSFSFSPSYAPVPPIYVITGTGSIGVNLALTAPISAMRLGNGTVTYSVKLEDDELAMLLAMV